MQLDDFVAECLSQIIRGVARAQQEAIPTGALVNPHLRTFTDPSTIGHIEGHGGQVAYVVEFDVAVLASETRANTGKAGLEVLSIGLSTKRDSQHQIGTESRVRFKVPLFLPIQER